MWAPLLFALSLLPSAFATPLPSPTPIPVILWHGLGDRFDNEGLLEAAELIKLERPGTHVHIVALSTESAGDQRATFFGNVTAQSDEVCTTLSSDPLLTGTATRVDGLGFSQGGLFMRGLVQRCPGLKFRSLVTFGSPHNGIAQLASCGTWDFLCKSAVAALASGRWSALAQGNVVPAQYFREVNETTGLAGEEYLEYSAWLADVNNEREVKNGEYAERLGGLEKFAMYQFENDTTLLPKETSWFADVNMTDGKVTPLRERLMYKEDWLGLRELDDRDALVFRLLKGARHMAITEKALRGAVRDFFGPDEKKTAAETTVRAGERPEWRVQDGSFLSGDW